MAWLYGWRQTGNVMVKMSVRRTTLTNICAGNFTTRRRKGGTYHRRGNTRHFATQDQARCRCNFYNQDDRRDPGRRLPGIFAAGMKIFWQAKSPPMSCLFLQQRTAGGLGVDCRPDDEAHGHASRIAGAVNIGTVHRKLPASISTFRRPRMSMIHLATLAGGCAVKMRGHFAGAMRLAAAGQFFCNHLEVT